MEKHNKVLVEVENPQSIKAISVRDWENNGCPNCGCKSAKSEDRTKTTDLMICRGSKCSCRYYVVVDDDFGKNKRSSIGFVEKLGDCEGRAIYPELP